MSAAPPADAPIPVTVLTGFLGSGKTTLLNALLARPELADCAVVINEWGEVALDHLLVRRVSDEMVVLQGGCVCCTVRGDLVTALRELFLKRVRGEVPEFRRLLIETTGLADPAPILHTLMTEPLLAARYRLDGVVCTVDAVTGGQTLDAQRESVKQAAVADRLVLTKLDLASDGAAALRRRLAALNPGARITEARHGAIDPAEILGCGLFDGSGRRPDLAGWLNAEAVAAAEQRHACGPECHGDHHPDHGHDHDHDHRHGAHDGIESFVVRLDEPVDWEPFALAIEILVNLRGANLLRVKGIVHARGHARPLVIHGVQHLFHPPAELPDWPDDDRRTRLVFITRDLPAAAVRALLNLAMVNAPDGITSQ